MYHARPDSYGYADSPRPYYPDSPRPYYADSPRPYGYKRRRKSFLEELFD